MENYNGVSTAMCSSVPLRVADGKPYTDRRAIGVPLVNCSISLTRPDISYADNELC